MFQDKEGFFQGLSDFLESCLFYKTERQASEAKAEKQAEGLHK